MRRIPALLSVVAILAFASNAWATGGPEASTTTAATLHCFVHYSSDGEKAVFDYASAQIKKRFPNVTIIPDVMPQDNNQKIKTLAATGDLPDLLEIDGGTTALFNESNLILPLDSYVKANNIASYFYPAANPFLKDGKGRILSVGNTVRDIVAIIYNKKLFADNGVKVPTNYAEYLAAVKTFAGKGITPLALFAKSSWTVWSLFDMIVTTEQPGGLQKIEQKGAKFTDAAYVDAARKLKELVDAGLLSKDAFTTDYDPAKAAFRAGQAAMFLNGSWECGGPDSIGLTMGDNVGLLYAGVFGDKAGGWSSSGGGFGNGYCVPTTSKNKDTAANIAGYIAVAHIEGRIVKAGSLNTVLVNAPKAENPYSPLQLQLQADFKNFNAGTCFWWGLVNSKVQAAFDAGLAKLTAGQVTADQFITQTNTALNDALAQ
jgi:raffinose/stachyose/melibiose transport system substrate-binding protein